MIDSKGATEVMARINQCSLVADISSTGKTAKDNGLKIKDGLILNSTAALLVSKKSAKNSYVSSFFTFTF